MEVPHLSPCRARLLHGRMQCARSEARCNSIVVLKNDKEKKTMINPVSTITALSTAVKNVTDVTTVMLSGRKRNKLITKGQMRQLEVYIDRVVYNERMLAVGDLFKTVQTNLIESCNRIKGYENTFVGDLLLEIISEEAVIYKRIIDDFIHTGNGRGA